MTEAERTTETETPAIRALRVAGIAFEIVHTERPVDVVDSAAKQGIEVSALVRTIVVRRGADDYLFVLVPGHRQIDWARLRSVVGVRRLSLPDKEEAKAATGYERGAITPFGATRRWPVIADASVVDPARIAIGGGARGVNVHLDPADLIRATDATVAEITRPDPPPPV